MGNCVNRWFIEAATIEPQGIEGDGIQCEGCEAPCCRGSFYVTLTQKEFFSGMYPIRFLNIPEMTQKLGCKNVITLAMGVDKCFYLDANSRCTIYNERPEGCRLYDCKKDKRKSFKEFVKRRFS